MAKQDQSVECLPVLPSLNLEETKAFYVDRLGFGIIHDDETYLILRREEMELHFWLAPDRQLCENSSVYIRGGRVDELHKEFSTKKLERLSEFSLRDWNMEEFYLHDPHGNLLRFGRIPQ